MAKVKGIIPDGVKQVKKKSKNKRKNVTTPQNKTSLSKPLHIHPIFIKTIIPQVVHKSEMKYAKNLKKSRLKTGLFLLKTGQFLDQNQGFLPKNSVFFANSQAFPPSIPTISTNLKAFLPPFFPLIFAISNKLWYFLPHEPIIERTPNNRQAVFADSGFGTDRHWDYDHLFGRSPI